MEYVKVESPQIAEVGFGEGYYGPETLGIRFQPTKKQVAAIEDGSEYHYQNVTPRTYQGLMAAPSIGSYFWQNIKSHPALYPYTKIDSGKTYDTPGAINIYSEPFALPLGQITPHGAGAHDDQAMAMAESDEPTKSTVLAVIDSMADDLLFTPNAVTDAQLAAGRAWYLTEAKKYDISTDEKRMELKRFARPLQKLRTSIEARAKELTGATKRKIAAIDAEKRRLVQIVGGIEDEVLAPLTSWEREEDARKIRLANTVNYLADRGAVVSMLSVAEIEAAIAKLEAFDLSTMQEYKIGAESAIIASLKVLKPELERRKEMEAQAAELAQLRAEAAERAEQDRMAAAAKAAREQAERDAALELQYAESKRLAAEQAVKDAETRRILAEEKAARDAEIAAAQAERDQEAAVEAERKRVADAADAQFAAAESRAANAKHRKRVNSEAVEALMACSLNKAEAETVVSAIAGGSIPHVTITY